MPCLCPRPERGRIVAASAGEQLLAIIINCRVTFGEISPFSPAPAREVVGAVEAIGDIEYCPVFKKGPEGSFMMTGHLAKDPCQVDPVRKFSTFVDDGLDSALGCHRIDKAKIALYPGTQTRAGGFLLDCSCRVGYLVLYSKYTIV